MGIFDKIKEIVSGAQIQSAAKTTYKVIDVSEWQGSIDWAKVKSSGVVGAIIRYADGNYLDPKFDYNMKSAKANGLHIGAYIYSRAKTKAQAEQEATRIYNAAKKYSPDMPLYIDLEGKGLSKYADTVAIAYLTKMKALGGRGGVYANLNWWNNYLKKTAKNYNSNPFWIAPYNSTMNYKPASYMGMWQYSSSGTVKGIKGRVDMNKCYIAYWDGQPAPEKKPYSGTYPTLELKKTNSEVIADTIRWAKWIVGDNHFHYGYGKEAHHNGCHFCGTEDWKKNKGIVDYEFTYCCNPFVGAAWAHGGCVRKALQMCQDHSSWDFSKGKGYDKSKLFDNLGHPAKKNLKAGDVLCKDNHVALYIGDGKIAHATGGDDNKRNSKKWNNSIRIEELTDAKYKGFKRVHRYNSSVNWSAPIRYGEIGERVKYLQLFLAWYGISLTADGIFGEATLNAVKKFQTDMKLGVDGIVGAKTLEKMKAVKK